MLFNSINFIVFLIFIYTIYWSVDKRKLVVQNTLLLLASYFFYACWDWRFLFLLIFSISLDYFSGIKIENATTKKAKKAWLWISIVINLGFLGVFKYYNFFVDSFQDLVAGFGFEIHLWTINVVLPVGISFYTFHGLSYVIDIYNDKIKAEKNIVDYSLFVSFFPLLVAGPIERATHLLPQLKVKRAFDYSKTIDGLRQILWGLFKKVVIADQCAKHANLIFDQYTDYSGLTLVAGAVFFAFQIYGDFSGYSDIALGTARLFGVELLQNFSFPYFSRNISEFWRRWHISLSSWFRDYLYIPLGGGKGGLYLKLRNTLIIFLVSGFWHGANWTFIIWGLINALYIFPLIIFNVDVSDRNSVATGKVVPRFSDLCKMVLTFFLVVIAWIFFRSSSVEMALEIVKKIFSSSFSHSSVVELYNLIIYEIGLTVFVLLLFFILVEWSGRESKYALQHIGLKRGSYVRIGFYYLLLLLIFIFGGQTQEFIYFQF